MSVRLAVVAFGLLVAGIFLGRAENVEDAKDIKDQDPSSFQLFFNGYGTLGLVHSSEDRADFLSNSTIKRGAGYTRSWSPELDSRLGVQATATLTPRISAVVQILVEQQSDGSYTPRVEWANVKYQITPEASVRIGRIIWPIFMVSDHRKIGFVNVWARPPVEVYGLIPLSSGDGVDASYRFALGEFRNTLQANYGKIDSEFADGGDLKGRNSWGLTVSSERGDARARLGYQQTNVHIEGFDEIFDAFRQFGPEGISIAERYEVDGSVLRFFSVGAEYDPGTWFAMAESAKVQSRTVIGDRTGWYVSGGYRFGRLTPYLTYASSDTSSNVSDPGLTLSSLPPELRDAAAGVNAGLNAILGSRPIQDSVSIGGRWQLLTTVDLKAQFDHSRLGAGSAGRLGNLQPEFTPGGSYNLVSFVVDFVF